MQKVYLSILGVIFSSIALNAQIGGVSGSKLGSFCADVVDHKRLEFEPGLYSLWSNSYWDSNKDQHSYFASPDSFLVDKGMYIRLTYGLWDKLEIGGAICNDLVSWNLGAKYLFLRKKSIEVAALAGLNAPISFKGLNKNSSSEMLTTYGAGLISTIQLTEGLSMDFTAQYLLPMGEPQWKQNSEQYYHVDFGYYVNNNQLQLIAGVNYSRSHSNAVLSEMISTCHGCTIENDKYILVVCINRDVLGRNTDKKTGGLLALTLLF
jgi:hypothetical protein